jgi:hypothetical protein
MSSPWLSAVNLLEGGWAWLYTAGLPEREARDRRAQIQADNHDFCWWARECGVRSAGFLALAQFVAGMPADVLWRVGLGRGSVSRDQWQELGIACLLLVGLFVGLPSAITLAALYEPGMEESGGAVVFATAVYLILVLLMLVGGGVIVMERWPTAGAVLIVLGSLCGGIAMWWLIHLTVVFAAGGVTAVVLAARARAGRDHRP